MSSPVEMAVHDKPGPGICEVRLEIRHAFTHDALSVTTMPPAWPVVELVAVILQRRAPTMEAGAAVAEVEPGIVLLEPLE